jgi:glycosyltransferase involved in cell wall biosynthesis
MKLRSQHFITIIASQFEILPYSILEAMSFGSPIVSSSVGGIPELISNEKNGLLFESQDVSGIVTQCRRLLVNPGWAAELGASARRFCRNNLDANHLAIQTAMAYRDAIQQHGSKNCGR